MERNPSEGPLVHMIWGEAVDVLTHDETGGETDNQVVAAAYSYAEWKGSQERDIVIDLNEWCGSSASSEAQLGASSSSYKIKWDVDQIVPASICFIPTRDPRYRVGFDLRRHREEESGVINHPRRERTGGVEGGFDLADIDGSAGVRNSRENVEVEGGG